MDSFLNMMMRVRLFLAVVGLGAFFVVERYFSGHAHVVLLRGLALASLGLSILVPVVLMLRIFSKQRGKARGLQFPILWQSMVFFGLLLFYLYLKVLGVAAEPTSFTGKILLGAWLVLLIVGIFTGVGVEIVFAHGVNLDSKRLVRGSAAWASIGLLLASLVAINFTANKKNKTFDWSYLKTSTPSESTLKILANLTEPVEIGVFFPAQNEVLIHVRDYLQVIPASERISISYVDRDIDPNASEKFRTTRNGQIVLTQKGNFERIDVGTNLGSARKVLRNLDQEFQKALLTLTSERKMIYFSSGHGELSWRGKAGGEDPLRMLRNLETFLRNQNYALRFWGAGEGSLKEVPRDAAAVVVAGHTTPFLEEEVRALEKFLEDGGSLMVLWDLDSPNEESIQVVRNFDVTKDPLWTFMNAMGIGFVPVPLGNNSNYVNATRSPIDSWFLFTNNFASHDSIPSLTKHDERIAILTFKSGYFNVTSEKSGWQNSEVIRSLSDTFNDDDKNFQFTERSKETRKDYVIGTASVKKRVEGPSPQGRQGKVVAFSDATALSDAVLKNPGNLVYFADSFKWLVGDTKIQGSLAAEEDVRIRHTRNEDLAWFYGTVVAVPLIVLGAGFVATRRGKRKSEVGA